MDIKFCVKHRGVVKDETAAEIEDFCKLCPPEEGEIYIFEDEIKRALFCECHIRAGLVISYGTIDVPLDAENQGEYRANRDVVEDSAAFIQMKEDALNGRSFSNIVAEYNTAFDGEHPLKIIGGQHRYIAIAEALERGVEKFHGVKVYFGLNMEQRLDVQLISNTNIAVSSDLLDRMLETVKGPQLRDWCQSAGLLREHEDFADRKQRGSRFTVRAARTFIMNYYEGSAITSKDFSDRKTTPVLAKTGGVDDEWERLKLNHPGMWEDAKLLAAGRAFSELMKKTEICVHQGGRQGLKRGLCGQGLQLRHSRGLGFCRGCAERQPHQTREALRPGSVRKDRPAQCQSPGARKTQDRSGQLPGPRHPHGCQREGAPGRALFLPGGKGQRDHKRAGGRRNCKVLCQTGHAGGP